MKVAIGDKVYIPSEKRPYTVKARDDRYIICTKPFNLQNTVFYFIIDLVENGELQIIWFFVLGMKLMKIVWKD